MNMREISLTAVIEAQANQTAGVRGRNLIAGRRWNIFYCWASSGRQFGSWEKKCKAGKTIGQLGYM
jgi:hypothetical protein